MKYFDMFGSLDDKPAAMQYNLAEGNRTGILQRTPDVLLDGSACGLSTGKSASLLTNCSSCPPAPLIPNINPRSVPAKESLVVKSLVRVPLGGVCSRIRIS